MTRAPGMWLSLHSACGLPVMEPAMKRLVGRQRRASLGSDGPSLSGEGCEDRAEDSPTRF